MSSTDRSEPVEEMAEIESRYDSLSLAFRVILVTAVATGVVGFLIWKQKQRSR